MTIGIHLPSIPIIAPNPVGQSQAADDAIVPDEKMLLSALLENAGWGPKSSDTNRTARGIIGAESGFDPTVVNYIPCVGLMQINAAVWPGKCGIPANKQDAIKWLKDPANNVEAGHCVYKAQGWTAWETYTNGSYKRFVGQDPTITAKKKTATGAVETALSPLASVAKLIAALFDPSTWFRVGKGWLGGILIILGTGALVFMVASRAMNTPVGKTVKKGATAAVAAAAL